MYADATSNLPTLFGCCKLCLKNITPTQQWYCVKQTTYTRMCDNAKNNYHLASKAVQQKKDTFDNHSRCRLCIFCQIPYRTVKVLHVTLRPNYFGDNKKDKDFFILSMSKLGYFSYLRPTCYIPVILMILIEVQQILHKSSLFW